MSNSINIDISIDRWKWWVPFVYRVEGHVWDVNVFEPLQNISRNVFSLKKARKTAYIWSIGLEFAYGKNEILDAFEG